MQEFHISRVIRDRYQFDERLFGLNGNVVFADTHAVRVFVNHINSRLDPAEAAEKSITAGNIYAMGLIDEILHYLFGIYRKETNPSFLQDALDHLSSQLGAAVIQNTLLRFTEIFPPISVYKGEFTAAEYIQVPENQLTTFEELLLLNIANINPAFMQYGDFFDDTNLSHESAYTQVVDAFIEFAATQPGYGPDSQDIFTVLHEPAVISPHSLDGQLRFIRTKWGKVLESFLSRLLSSIDLIAEETKAIFGGPGPAHIPDYASLKRMLDLETERFSPDKDWMPRLVLIAKNSYVWLFQLSREYGREITRLDQIPDEELDRMAKAGFSGLWLIGLWERSKASENIKRMCGNPEAVASAYSIADYRIADDLGGPEALRNLKDRAWQRGIRMASDMVPNHMGIDSDWVSYHPDYFVSLDHSPFPAYTFNGPNLSRQDGIGIFLEDHYYNRSDASVVFKRVDFSSGKEQFIYHGNDGTSMPWNDTAQLNYLSEQVRQEVIQLILNVARDFPIIRFDAAMTLAKKHYQRLWFPEPGTGGAIPSRSEHGLTFERFDQLFPLEFWREVVDRVAAEVPDTLLLAEAFWLMEGYFVRTLGMHRVYNSAFMNMLRNEDNAKYRSVMKNTLEFDPEIMKRFVNFMNNPDEKTAVEQFGKGDKYFGVCALMVTLPGLPMVGHGQVEGYTEKYGMEYRRAYLDEQPDGDLVRRHEYEIYPIIHQRHLFSGVELFRLYDFYTSDGSVNEDVYAYSNGFDSKRTLVVFHNKFGSVEGWIRVSAAFLDKSDNKLKSVSLGDGLAVSAEEGRFVILHDHISGLDYLRTSQELHEQGLFVQLHAYQYHIFTDIYEIIDDDSGSWRQLYHQLGGRPIKDIQSAHRLQKFSQLHLSLTHLLGDDSLALVKDILEQEKTPDQQGLVSPSESKLSELTLNFLHEVTRAAGVHQDKIQSAAQCILEQLKLVSSSQPPAFIPSQQWAMAIKNYKHSIQSNSDVIILWSWIIFHNLPHLVESATAYDLVSEFALTHPFKQALACYIPSEQVRENQTTWLHWALSPTRAFNNSNLDIGLMLKTDLEDEITRTLLAVNYSNGMTWFHQEGILDWLEWYKKFSLFLLPQIKTATWTEKLEQFIGMQQELTVLQSRLPQTAYRLDALLELANHLRADF